MAVIPRRCKTRGCKEFVRTMDLCRKCYDALPEQVQRRADYNRRRIQRMREEDPDAYRVFLDKATLAQKRFYQRQKQRQNQDSEVLVRSNGASG